MRNSMQLKALLTEMNDQWSNYQKNYEYAAGIAFTDTCRAVVEILEKIMG